MASTNALANEKSPYLRQHANNPVNWLPWGEAAFAKARSEDKPIFLSIGYSTCHWCHVMAHESFEDEHTAQVLNRYFVPVKIDREERPDIDRVYMLFVQASTGSGGWPMSVWLTPDLKPFYGGTYFPPDNRYGRPGFRTLLQHLANAWRDDRTRIMESSGSVTSQLSEMAANTKENSPVDRALTESGFWHFRRSYDAKDGGFGAAPKFPRPSALHYLLCEYATSKNEEALEMVTHTLRKMAAGGMHDQLGGGFHRYSVDERWFVPHFEKMLYDQAQLVLAYLETFQATGDRFFADTVRDILHYVARDLTSPDGAFYSAEDADSADPENPAHHREGSFYIWRKSEIQSVLGAQAESMCERFGVEPDGNVEMDPHGEFSGRNILVDAKPDLAVEDMERSKEKLLKVRSRRPRPHLDTKILAGWNGLMISAFARSGAVLGNAEDIDRARHAADFLLQVLYDEKSLKMQRRFCDGEAAIPAFADDYAMFAQGLLDLFEATGEVRYLQVAFLLLRQGLVSFRDDAEGGFFSTAAAAPDVLIRMKDDYDGAEPSANSVLADVLLRLAHLTGDQQLDRDANRTLQWLSGRLRSQPSISPQGLAAAMRSVSGSGQVVIRCAEVDARAREIAANQLRQFAPFDSVLLVPDTSIAALSQYAPFLASLDRKGAFTIYRCRDLRCELPQVWE